jgi:O-antigen/teichoic acid export membrane protein
MSDRRPGPDDLEARRNAGTCLALFGLLAVGSGLFALAVVILPDLMYAVAFGAVLVGFVLFHYLTWGHWLSRPRPDDPQAEDPHWRAEPPEADRFAADAGDVD